MSICNSANNVSVKDGNDFSVAVNLHVLRIRKKYRYCVVDAMGILLKLNVKTGEVKILMSKELTGQDTIFRNAVKFKDKLYFCGAVNMIPCIYHMDPKTDECKQVYAGMTLEEYMEAYQKGGVSRDSGNVCV